MFVGTVLAIPTSFVSGYISDTIPTKQHIVMKVTSLCQLICQTFSIWLIFMHTSWASVLAGWFYQMRQAMFSQSMASIWKLLKMRLNFIEMSSDEKNALSNSISNSGDLFTELFEFAFILPMFLFPMSVSTVLFLACSASMIANIILVIIVFFYIRVFYYGLISKQTDNEEQDNQKTTSCGLSFCYEQVRKVRTIVVDCAHYITTTGVVLHTLVHTLGFMMLYVLICYPFALEAVQKSSGGKMNSLLNQTATIPAAKSDAIVTVEAVLIPTRENFCGGLVLDLMKQGFVLNIVFFVASIVYSQTLSDIAPRVFFKRINPVLLAITAGCLISVSLLNRVVGSTPALVVMSTAQVIPWYLSSYSYVTFNTAVSSENYGVTTMVYSLGQQLIYVVGTYLMSLYVPLWVLLVMCLGIVAVLVVHSLYIAPLFFSSDWGSSSASSEKL
ncbi:hypothetical protein Pelo_15643 [Pelomyxa schiedti]|nr:hypothetical protein Pelo_15643 [Pelomyxa schiedti]